MTVIPDYCFPWLSSFIYINFELGTKTEVTDA